MDNSKIKLAKYRLNPAHLIAVWRRRFKRKKVLGQSNKSSKKLSRGRFLKKIKSIHMVILAILAMFVFTGVHVREYLQIKPKSYDGQYIQREFTNPDLNVAIFVENQVDGNAFIEGITIVSINTSDNEIKTVGVSTQIIAKNTYNNELYTLKTLFNQIPHTEKNIVSYAMLVEKSTGIRIDRYILMDVSSIDFLAQKYSLSTKVAESVNAAGREYIQHQKVEPRHITTYLFDAEEGDSKTKNIASFFQLFLKDQTGIIGSYLAFWRSNIFLDNSYTDLSKSEFFTWVDLLGSSQFKDVFVLGENVSISSSTGVEEGLGLNSVSASESLREYLRSFSVLTEQAQVELYNATSTSGLASSMQKKLDVYGINVVKIGNSTETRVNTKIFVFSDLENPYTSTLSLIKKTLQSENLEIEYRSSSESGNYAADIVIIMGEDSI